jgi:hypothetical protein
MDKVDRTTTRRALLAAAAGGAATLAAQAVAPLAASAHDVDDVKLGDANTATATTGIDTSATAGVNAFSPTAAGGSAVVATNTGATGSGVVAKSATEAAVYAVSGNATDASLPADAKATGVYGYSPATAPTDPAGAGVWGESGDIGVAGNGSLGVLGDGRDGGVGVIGLGNIGVQGEGYGTGGKGVVGLAADPGTIGVLGIAGVPTAIGVHARADAVDRTALKVTGKVAFSRSNKATIAAGASSKAIGVAGVTTGSWVFAMLASNRPGRWVRAVVPAAGKFTIYLNTTVSSATTVVWWIIN